MWKITDQLVLDAGISNIWYQNETVSFDDPDLGSSYKETYGKKSFSAAIGLSYSIF